MAELAHQDGTRCAGFDRCAWRDNKDHQTILELPCPLCNRPNNRLRAVNEAPDDPRLPRHLGICWGCKGVFAIELSGSHGTARPLTIEEQPLVMADPLVKRTMAAVMESEHPSEIAALLGKDT